MEVEDPKGLTVKIRKTAGASKSKIKMEPQSPKETGSTEETDRAEETDSAKDRTPSIDETSKSEGLLSAEASRRCERCGSCGHQETECTSKVLQERVLECSVVEHSIYIYGQMDGCPKCV